MKILYLWLYFIKTHHLSVFKCVTFSNGSVYGLTTLFFGGMYEAIFNTGVSDVSFNKSEGPFSLFEHYSVSGQWGITTERKKNLGFNN